MSVDQAAVRRIARLARIAVSDAEVPHLQSEINAILAFVEELGAVDVEGVEPMTSVIPMKLPMREDVVTDGEIAPLILVNAPFSEEATDFYHWHVEVMPKLTRTAGFESGTGFYINPTSPEEAADVLRTAKV